MFVRVRKQPGKEGSIPYAYLVENHWNPFRKKHEQKILMALGRLTDLPADGTVEKIITALDSFAAKMGFSSLSDGVILNNLSSSETLLSSALEYGAHLLTCHILTKLSFFSTLTDLLTKKPDTDIALQKVLEALPVLIALRLYDDIAVSEVGTFQWYTNRLFTPEKKQLGLMDLYRSLDVLIENKDTIEQQYYEQNKTLFHGELDIVLFDTTSVYYYGKQDPERSYGDDDLLQYGFSKDGKGDVKQLIVGVLMTREGVPIAHEVFKGNTSDMVSFAAIIKLLKEKYHIGKVILIADRGMISEDNIRLLETEQLSYLLGVRMRKLSPMLREKLLRDMEDVPRGRQDMEKVQDNLYTYEYPLSRLTEKEMAEMVSCMEKKIQKKLKKEQLTLTQQHAVDAGVPLFDKAAYQEALKKRKYFVCLNPFIQQSNKKKREKFTQIIKQKIETKATKEWIVKNGYKKYIEFEDKVSLKVNEEKLKEEELYDGKWVLITNDATITAGSAGMYYKSLQFVERGFHDLKSLITVRPIYHWKEERIKAHIFVCFLALIVKWYICRSINSQTQEEGKRFIEEMLNLKAIAVDEKIPLYVRTALTPELQEQMKKLGMKIPGKIILDGRITSVKPNPKGGRPRKVDPGQFQLPYLQEMKKKQQRISDTL